MPLPHDGTGENWRQLTPEQFEELRHAHEVNHCITEGYEFTTQHVAGVRDKRGAAQAQRIWVDVKANWQADADAARKKLQKGA